MAEIRLNADRYLKQYLEEMNGLFTPNEMTTLGVMAELRLKAKPGKIMHIGFDIDRYLLQGLSSGEIAGLVLQQPREMGYMGVKLAVDALNGKRKNRSHHLYLGLLPDEGKNENTRGAKLFTVQHG